MSSYAVHSDAACPYAVRSLDLASDDDMAAAHEVHSAAISFERPYETPRTFVEWTAEARHVSAIEDHEILGAFDGDELVGVALLWVPLTSNTTQLWLDIAVTPLARRRGVGAVLAEAVEARARQLGRTVLLAETFIPPRELSHPHVRFAEAVGYAVANLEIGRQLVLPVDDGLLERLDTQARPYWESEYDVLAYRGLIPPEYQQGYCDIGNLLGVDAPTGDIEFEPETHTPQEYRAMVETLASAGRTRLTTLAVHRATGAVAAHTDLIVSADPEHVHQWGTYVHRDHRGRRLGTAVKVANLRQLQDRFPGARRITTCNAETNQWMVDINERLGFAVIEHLLALKRQLADPAVP